jgi:hypothetical protein
MRGMWRLSDIEVIHGHLECNGILKITTKKFQANWR